MKKVFLKENLEIQNNFEYQIIEICNAQKTHKVLELSHDTGILMPKSIIISYSDKKNTSTIHADETLGRRNDVPLHTDFLHVQKSNVNNEKNINQTINK